MSVGGGMLFPIIFARNDVNVFYGVTAHHRDLAHP